MTSVNSDNLAGLVLISLCKGNAFSEFNLERILSKFVDPQFAKVNKLFFTHYTNASECQVHPATILQNSIVLTVSSTSNNVPHIFKTFKDNFEVAFQKPVKKCFQVFHDEACYHRTCV